jgi:hypothetical protein
MDGHTASRHGPHTHTAAAAATVAVAAMQGPPAAGQPGAKTKEPREQLSRAQPLIRRLGSNYTYMQWHWHTCSTPSRELGCVCIVAPQKTGKIRVSKIVCDDYMLHTR